MFASSSSELLRLCQQLCVLRVFLYVVFDAAASQGRRWSLFRWAALRPVASQGCFLFMLFTLCDDSPNPSDPCVCVCVLYETLVSHLRDFRNGVISDRGDVGVK